MRADAVSASCCQRLIFDLTRVIHDVFRTFSDLGRRHPLMPTFLHSLVKQFKKRFGEYLPQNATAQ